MKNPTANQLAIQKFNAASTRRVVFNYPYPYLGGFRAEFHKNVEAPGGWLIATDSTGAASNVTYVIEITDAQVAEADAVEFDPYNDAAYSRALLNISDRIRGKSCDQEEECWNEFGA